MVVNPGRILDVVAVDVAAGDGDVLNLLILHFRDELVSRNRVSFLPVPDFTTKNSIPAKTNKTAQNNNVFMIRTHEASAPGPILIDAVRSVSDSRICNTRLAAAIGPQNRPPRRIAAPTRSSRHPSVPANAGAPTMGYAIPETDVLIFSARERPSG